MTSYLNPYSQPESIIDIKARLLLSTATRIKSNQEISLEDMNAMKTQAKNKVDFWNSEITRLEAEEK
ncbi:hypothetical protein [Listeria sp. ILCC792]|uniref:hypothetical protein n=1 Tax=Listeria sp. ILCC792 TaxID=1918331 RepID=UPI000B58AD80|nr:hypothetical protein [Listeria sp. ILCC792]